MNKLHLICVAVFEALAVGGLHPERAEALFNDLSPYFSNVPDTAIESFVDNIRLILDADLTDEAP